MVLKLLRSNMKKYIIFSLLFVNLGFGQNPEIKTELPSVIPPSPTVSALMKFEEVPVSNYTGIPDITIPLYNSPTLSKDINFNLALKYHSGVGANDRASDVGLGWSLIAGGTISRTVRGLPDELLINGSNLRDVRVGLYHDSNNVHINNYYYFTENIANETQDFYKAFNQLTTQQTNIGNEFLWSASFTNKYDTEHDLWQFNFMGNSGRFYIKKNRLTSFLEIVPLDDYRVKIVNHYTNVNGNHYMPSGFTIYDEKGYKYIFDVSENSINKFANSSTTFVNGQVGYSYSNQTNIHSDKEYLSSFHLSKVYDNNNELVIEFVFRSENFVESFTNSSTSSVDLDKYFIADRNNCQDLPPLESINNSSTTIQTKKINYIDVKGYSKIYFEYLLGRLDNNINLNSLTAYLNSVTIKDNNSNFIKKYNFVYDYSTVLNVRMILKSIKELYENDNFLVKSNFEYKSNINNGFVVSQDSWGFFNLIKECEVNTFNHRNVSPEFCTTDLLEKIIYPTGGLVAFEFEANTFSFVGDQPVTNYFEGNHNLELTNNTYHNFDNSNNTLYLGFLSNNYKKLVFGPSIVIDDLSIATRTFSLKKKVNNTWVNVNVSLHCQMGNCCIDFYPEDNVEYKIDYINLDLNYTSPETLSILYYSVSETIQEFLYGGGNRIKSIKYYETGGVNSPLSKFKKFNYSFFNNQNKSSGSLAFAKPVFEYFDMVSVNNSIHPTNEFFCFENRQDMIYKTFTSGNNLIALKTGGSDVGYKEVTVYEENLGKIEYQYISPIDVPEENIPLGHPFIPTKNFDFKRGLLKSEIVYDNIKKIQETINNYEIIEHVLHTGTRFRKPNGSCYTGSKFSYYDEYVNAMNTQPDCISCTTNFAMDTDFLCGLPLDLNTPKIMPFPIFEAYGWAKLINKTTKNYFYPNGSSTPNIVESVETYAYNPINKKISENTVSNSRGETLTTKYFYHTGNSIHSQNRISEIERIETYRGSELLSKSQIIYNNNWSNNVSFLPQTIQTAKGSEGYENRLQYLNYDEFGNPLEVKQEGGIHICYIWGYNQTQPIAKIENATYSQVQQYVANLQTLSNGTNEASLITALNSLRTALPNAMITTYTYKPLVGISTVTDPKGDKQTYHYDSFNRLQFVKDAQGNILSENQYHFRTQN